jgi:hypothetical protein
VARLTHENIEGVIEVSTIVMLDEEIFADHADTSRGIGHCEFVQLRVEVCE